MIPLVGTFFTHESQIKFYSSSLFVANSVGEQLVKQRLAASRAIYIYYLNQGRFIAPYVYVPLKLHHCYIYF